MRQFSRPEVQALVVAVTGVLTIALVPQRYAERASTDPISLIFRRTFFLNGLLTFALWLVLLVAVQPLVESRKHMREDSMIFLFPAMLILPALAAGGIAHYFVRRHRTAS